MAVALATSPDLGTQRLSKYAIKTVIIIFGKRGLKPRGSKTKRQR